MGHGSNGSTNLDGHMGHGSRMVYLWVRVTVMVSELSISCNETYLVIALFDLSLIRTRATSLDSQLLGIDTRRNKVNKWVWRNCFRFSSTFCVPISGVSAVSGSG